MKKNRMQEIVKEEIENLGEALAVKNSLKESKYDGVSKKASVLKAVADFGNAIEKFEENMSIQMKHSFDPILDSLKSLLNDVGSNTDSFLDREEKARRSVILKKSNDEVVSENNVKVPKFYDSLEESFKNKKQS